MTTPDADLHTINASAESAPTTITATKGTRTWMLRLTGESTGTGRLRAERTDTDAQRRFTVLFNEDGTVSVWSGSSRPTMANAKWTAA